MKYLDIPNKADRVGRVPLRTLPELAEEFGVAPNAVITKMRLHPNAPAPKLRTGGRHYYEPGAFRTWWRSVQESQRAAVPPAA